MWHWVGGCARGALDSSPTNFFLFFLVCFTNQLHVDGWFLFALWRTRVSMRSPADEKLTSLPKPACALWTVLRKQLLQSRRHAAWAGSSCSSCKYFSGNAVIGDINQRTHWNTGNKSHNTFSPYQQEATPHRVKHIHVVKHSSVAAPTALNTTLCCLCLNCISHCKFRRRVVSLTFADMQ